MRHNEILDLTANLLTATCTEVQVEPNCNQLLVNSFS